MCECVRERETRVEVRDQRRKKSDSPFHERVIGLIAGGAEQKWFVVCDVGRMVVEVDGRGKGNGVKI